MSVIPTLGRLRQKDCFMLGISLGYMVKPWVNLLPCPQKMKEKRSGKGHRDKRFLTKATTSESTDCVSQRTDRDLKISGRRTMERPSDRWSSFIRPVAWLVMV